MTDHVSRAKGRSLVHNHNKNRLVGRVLRDYISPYKGDLIPLQGGVSVDLESYPELSFPYSDDSDPDATATWGREYSTELQATWDQPLEGLIGLNLSVFSEKNLGFGMYVNSRPQYFFSGKSTYGASSNLGGVSIYRYNELSGLYEWEDDAVGRAAGDYFGKLVEPHPTKALCLASAEHGTDNEGSYALLHKTSETVWSVARDRSGVGGTGFQPLAYFNEYQGWAISRGDDLVIISEPQRNLANADVGSVYVYELNATEDDLTYIQRIDAPTDAAHFEHFGEHLSTDPVTGEYFACVKNRLETVMEVAVYKRDVNAKTFSLAATIATGMTGTGGSIAGVCIVGNYVAITVDDTTDSESAFQIWKRDGGAETFTKIFQSELFENHGDNVSGNYLNVYMLTGCADAEGTGAYFTFSGPISDTGNSGATMYYWADAVGNVTERFSGGVHGSNYHYSKGVEKWSDMILGPPDPDKSTSGDYSYREPPLRYLGDLFRKNAYIPDHSTKPYGPNDYLVVSSYKGA